MKTLTVFLALSVVANLVALGIFVAGAVGNRGPASPAADATAAAGLWTELHSEDPRLLADKLRADGFPPAMIRSIVATQIRAQFAARRKSLEAAQGELPFWKRNEPDLSTQAALRALMMQEQKAIKDVLGSDPVNGAEATLRRQFPHFPDPAIDQIAAIRERYNEQRMEFYSGMRGPGALLPDEREKMQALDKAMHDEIAAVLSPQQLEDYDLRTSSTANQLRYSLVAFEPTEQEFRALFKLQSAFDEQHRYTGGPMSDEQMRARSNAQKDLQEQIKAALGPERFAEYQRATDYHYQQTTQLVARLNLPPETATSLYAVQKEFEQRRTDLYRSGAGGPAGSDGFTRMVEQSTALQKEAVARVTSLLGEPSRVEAYKQYGGSWITSMVPRPPPSGTATQRIAPRPPAAGSGP